VSRPRAGALQPGEKEGRGSALTPHRHHPGDVLPGLARSEKALQLVPAEVRAACWDASAIAAGLPLVRMLGGVPKPVPAYNSNGLGLMAPEAAADEAEALLEGGFRAIKLRLGYPGLDADLAAVRAVRRRVSGNILLMVDFNQALTVAEAIRRGRALEGEGIYWIEEPIRHDDYPGNAEVAGALATPCRSARTFPARRRWPRRSAQRLATTLGPAP